MFITISSSLFLSFFCAVPRTANARPQIMMLLPQVWPLLLLPSPPVAQPTSPIEHEAGVNADLFATLEPLVGGPPWLRLHIVLHLEGTAFDFLPCEPLAPRTASALLTGAAVPGDIRCRERRRPTACVLLGRTARTTDELIAHAKRHPSALALGRNDCWTFAASLRDFALLKTEGH